MIIEDAKPNSKDFSSRNDKRNEVLLELLNHTIHKHLPQAAQCAHYKQMNQELLMLSDENKHIHY